MPQQTPDHDGHPREARIEGDDATTPPVRRTRSSTQNTWRVERIDTEPMTAQQYDLAVTTLAALITRWRINQENAKETRDESA
ncbi:hypothetical protein [Lentzea sp. NPDC060358]|uniref:hypothetical protein n=1 Tax=Lentzea sp. NPDC060358 TaxID=3347103 RepID=UPI00366564EB